MKEDQLRIARAYPHLTEAQASVALLSETLELSQRLARARRQIRNAAQDEGRQKELLAATGTMEEIREAERAANATMEDILARVSERDLQEGRDAMRLTDQEYEKALGLHKLMELEQTSQRDQDLGLKR